MWGLRNPWRFSFDRATGDALDRRRRSEQVRGDRLRARGREGHQLGLERARGIPRVPRSGAGRARDPLLETKHSDGNCAIVGGYVYRGKAIPALDGVYVFGDDCRPNLVGVVAAGGKVVAQRDLGPTVSQLTSFGEDNAGEIYAIGREGTVYRIVAA